MDVYSRKSIVNTFKTDLTSQFNRYHQIKLGVEYRTTSITYNNLTVLQASYTTGRAIVREPEDNEIHDSFQSMVNPFTDDTIDGRHPQEFSAIYKIKLKKMI